MFEIIRIADYIAMISPVILSLGSIIGLAIFDNFRKDQKILIFYIIIMLFIDKLANYMWFIQGNNLILVPLSSFIELVSFFLFIYFSSLKVNIIYIFIFCLIVALNITEFIFCKFNDFNQLQIYSLTLNPLFILVFYISYLIKKIINDDLESRNILTYIFPIYLTISALINLPLNFLINYRDPSVFWIWIPRSINIIGFYFVIVYSLWKFGKTQKLLSFGF